MAAIRSSKVFIALLTPKYLATSKKTNDWVRMEIECAVENNVHIVPITIDRKWKGFPNDCPEHLLQIISQHDFSEVYIGQPFTPLLEALVKKRICPYVKLKDYVVVHVMADMDCRVVKVDEEIASISANKWCSLRLEKGTHILDFISKDNPIDCLRKEYIVRVEDLGSVYYVNVQLEPIKLLRISGEGVVSPNKSPQQGSVVREDSIAVGHQSIVTEVEDKKYNIGDLYDDGVKQGVVCSVDADGLHGKIISLVEGELKWAKSDVYRDKVSTVSKIDGEANMLAVQKSHNWQKRYPAFAWCANLGKEWYLPAVEELKIFALDNNLRIKINKAMQTPIRYMGRYWSSTEGSELKSQAVSMRTGNNIDNENRSSVHLVRAIAKF